MIALKSTTSDGSEYQVFDDEKLIGHIHLKKGLSGNRYLASIFQEGKEQPLEKNLIVPRMPSSG